MTKTKQKIGKNSERGKKLMEWGQSWGTEFEQKEEKQQGLRKVA